MSSSGAGLNALSAVVLPQLFPFHVVDLDLCLLMTVSFTSDFSCVSL